MHGIDKLRELRGNVKLKGAKKYDCNLCGKTYTQQSCLNLHITVYHEGLKNHICELCGKAFGQSSGLKKHVENVHVGIKNHICNICGNAFGALNTLQVCIIFTLEMVIFLSS